MTIPSITPADAQRLIAAGALLIDIREPDEHARARIPGAVNLPLNQLGRLDPGGRVVVFHCRSGARAAANAARLAAASDSPCHVLAGGLDGWRREGLPVTLGRRQPPEIMRQVQLVAGGLVLLGVTLGLVVAPAFFGLSAMVGAGLMMAGATGWCGMATLLRRLPWNRPAGG